MKHAFKFTKALFLAFLLLTFSCSNDDDNTVVINLQGLDVTIDENPTNGDLIGTVQSNSTGSLTFSITSQTPTGALSINGSTGELTVADASLFDYEANTIITAIVSADEASNQATVTINLNNINELGDFNHGGVVFWIDPTDDTKGLVCSIVDQTAGVRWDNPSGPSTSVSGTSIDFGTGSSNTDLIIAHEGGDQSTYAAGVARAYDGGGFNDWFLPSTGEMTEVFNNITIINTTSVANGGANISTVTDYYWSSSRQPNTTESVYLFSFINGGANGVLPINSRPVRAVRAFQ